MDILRDRGRWQWVLHHETWPGHIRATHVRVIIQEPRALVRKRRARV